ncbi:MAG: hypothetical protein LBQ65_02370 [Tannerellaceae bacterium]|jgi:hypothetical protein|nr:hypothetical protein [Tannerellaceae bacterium]
MDFKGAILLILSVFCLTLASCGTTSKYTTHTTFVDFRPYTEAGFYFSMYLDCPYEYEYIGYIEVSIISGMDNSVKLERIATTDDVIKAVYDKAVEAEADGLIDLKFTYTKDPQFGNIIGTFASGVAIKRK